MLMSEKLDTVMDYLLKMNAKNKLHLANHHLLLGQDIVQLYLQIIKMINRGLTILQKEMSKSYQPR